MREFWLSSVVSLMAWRAVSSSVFLINLDRSPERLARIDQQLRSLDVAYTRVPGVDGRFLDPALRSAPRGNEWYFRPMENGDIGTYQSHRVCWQRVLDEGLDWAIVLEDDVVLAPTFREVPAAIAQLPQDWDLVKLSKGWRRRKTWRLGRAGEFDVVAFYKIPAGTQGYAVSRRGAERLLRGQRRIMRPVDIDMQCWWETKVEVVGLDPFPVSEAPGTASEAWRFDRRKKRRLTRMAFAFTFWLHNLGSWCRVRGQRRRWRAAAA